MHTKARGPDQKSWSPLPWNWWSPIIGARAADYEAKLHETFNALSIEWQAFIAKRVKEDLRALRQITSANSPEQIWTTSTRFWKKAAEDYALEYAAIVRLASDCVIPGGSLAAEDLHAGENPVPPISNAT